MDAFKAIGWVTLLCIVLAGAFGLILWVYYKIPGMHEWGERHEKSFKIAGGICLGIVIIWYLAIGDKTGSTWDGSGTINVFPTADSAKNYRLDSDYISVKVKRQGLFHNYRTYIISSANWPDGGTLEFTNYCEVSELDGRDKCTDQNGKDYYIEVQTPPDQPESDASGS